jgi:hypothetical protein
MPMSEYGKQEPKTCLLEEVELGVNYALVISTNAGLWRYVVGDTIMFTDLNPIRFKITGRTKLFINAFGEELMIDNAEKALSQACFETESMIKDYTAAPLYLSGKEAGAHEWFIEFEKAPNNFDQFTHLLDQYLQQANSDYEAKRAGDMALSLPQVRVCKEGTFYQWMKKRGKLGGQNKVPRLANDRRFVDELKDLL